MAKERLAPVCPICSKIRNVRNENCNHCHNYDLSISYNDHVTWTRYLVICMFWKILTYTFATTKIIDGKSGIHWY